MNMNFNFSQIALKMKASKIRELMKFASMPGVISFGGGMPDPQSFPFDDVKSIIETWDKKKAMTAMQYGPTPGYPALIDILKKRMIEKKNINMSDQELIITTGAQQAIFLMSRIFIDTDDIIIVEQPSFIGAIAAFVSNEAKLMGVPLQEDGVDVEYLEDLLKKLKSQGKKVKFFYTIPNFQNPAGVTMSLKKRKALYDISLKYDLVILEDDPYSDLYFTENFDDYVPIKSFGNDARIVYLGSFSKILCPGFRLGWMLANDAVIEKAILAKQSVDACSSSFGQVVAYDYLESDLMKNYLKKMRKIYRDKKNYMAQKIKKYFPDQVKSTNPDGGFFIYLDLPNGIGGDEVFKKAFQEKVAFVTGEPFHIDPEEGNKHIRLSYSNSSEENIDKGIKVIGRAIESLFGNRKNI